MSFLHCSTCFAFFNIYYIVFIQSWVDYAIRIIHKRSCTYAVCIKLLLACSVCDTKPACCAALCSEFYSFQLY